MRPIDPALAAAKLRELADILASGGWRMDHADRSKLNEHESIDPRR